MSLAGRVHGLRYLPAKARAFQTALHTSRAAAADRGMPWPTFLRHAARLRRRHGFSLQECITYNLVERGSPSTPELLSKRETLRLQRRVNPLAMEPVTEDKVVFAAFCRAAGLPTPQTLGLLTREGPGWMAGVEGPVTPDRWAEALGALDGEFVVKPVHGAHGDGVRVLVVEPSGMRDVERGPVTAAGLARSLADLRVHAWLVQRRLRSHPALEGLGSDDALHTLRMTTLVDASGPRLVMAQLRIGRQGVVDNFSGGTRGSMIVNVDMGDGRLTAGVEGRPDRLGVTRLPRHPDGHPWSRWAIPDWEATCALALRAAEAAHPLVTVGWDVAPTPSGPAVIEGNMWWDNPIGIPTRAMIPAHLYLPRSP